MDVSNLLVLLRGLDDNDLDMRIYFTQKNNNGTYTSYSPQIDTDLQIELKTLVIEALEKIENIDQREFNPIGTIEGYVETYPVNEVGSYEAIMHSMDEERVIRRQLHSEEIRKLNFYSLLFTLDDGNEVRVFRRVTKFNRLAKGKGFFGRFVANDFQKLEDDLLGIDPNIDIVIFNEEMLILNHISLERIFSIRDQYQEKASELLELVRRSGRVENFEQFRDDCLSDARITRALTKILNDQERVYQVFQNFENVIQVIDIFQLNIELVNNNSKLVYEDKSQLMDITRLIRDSYYISIINNREGVDEGV